MTNIRGFVGFVMHPESHGPWFSVCEFYTGW